MSTISTHVLDTALGRPAEGLVLSLSRLHTDGDTWVELTRQTTNGDGRVGDLLPAGDSLIRGTYRMQFETAAYLERAHGSRGFYPYVPIIFEVAADDEHYHVPLLLSPFGISTYRGS